MSLFYASNSFLARVLGKEDGKINLAVGEKICLDNSGGRKKLVRTFRRHNLWRCIGCILWAGYL